MNNRFRNYIVIFFSSIFLFGCVSEPDFPIEPEIEFLSISKNAVNFNDSLSVFISFTDGDGNIGNIAVDNATCSNVAAFLFDYTTPDSSCFLDPFYSAYLIDSRDSSYRSFFIPDLQPGGNFKSLSGQLELKYAVPFCKCGGCDTDSMFLEVVIKDRDNNYSNTVKTTVFAVTNCP